MATRRQGFARARRAAGLSQEALAAVLGIDRSTVVRWEAGDTEPQPWIRPKLARTLAISPAVLAELLDAVAPVSTAPTDALPADCDEGRNVSTVVVAALRLQLQQVQFEYDMAPSAGLLVAASQHHGRVTHLRHQVSAPRVRRELWALEAESATLMGQLIWDASQRRDHTSPRTYFNQAIEAARRIGDATGEAYATLRKSYLSLYGEKAPHRGLRCAQSAADVGMAASPALAGLSLLHVAEAHAMLGEPRACESALEQARGQLCHVGDADAAGEYLTPVEIERMAGSCYLFLGLPQKAEPILHGVAQSLASKKKSQSIVLGNLALAHTRQGELEAAAQALHRAIDALEDTRGGGGLNLAFEAGRELRPWRAEPAVQELHDRLFTLMSPG